MLVADARAWLRHCSSVCLVLRARLKRISLKGHMKPEPLVLSLDMKWSIYEYMSI